MSLKAFHLVFILASIALSVLFGVWCFEEYSYTDSRLTLFMGIGSLLSTVGLSAYLVWFLKKLRHIGFVALALLFSPQIAEACSVCIGSPESLAVKSANSAILFLLVVISSLLVGFAGLFIHWVKKDRHYSAS